MREVVIGSMDLTEIALNYLNADPLLHIDMILPIKRNTAHILYAADDGVCLKEAKSEAYMVSVSSNETGEKLLDLLPQDGLYTFHQEYMLEGAKEKVRHATVLENFQAVYSSKTLPPISSDGETEIKLLDHKDLHTAYIHYDIDVGEDYLRERLEDGELFGCYFGNDLIGFCGVHAEGSIGFLRVFDQYRRKGYGISLTNYAINYQLAKGVTPYIQINVSNNASLALAGKMGFSIAAGRVFWLF